MIPESYVVRIYGRDPTDPNRMEGILVAVNAECSQPFNSGDELLRLLTLTARYRTRPSERPGVGENKQNGRPKA